MPTLQTLEQLTEELTTLQGCEWELTTEQVDRISFLTWAVANYNEYRDEVWQARDRYVEQQWYSNYEETN